MGKAKTRTQNGEHYSRWTPAHAARFKEILLSANTPAERVAELCKAFPGRTNRALMSRIDQLHRPPKTKSADMAEIYRMLLRTHSDTTPRVHRRTEPGAPHSAWLPQDRTLVKKIVTDTTYSVEGRVSRLRKSFPMRTNRAFTNCLDKLWRGKLHLRPEDVLKISRIFMQADAAIRARESILTAAQDPAPVMPEPAMPEPVMPAPVMPEPVVNPRKAAKIRNGEPAQDGATIAQLFAQWRAYAEAAYLVDKMGLATRDKIVISIDVLLAHFVHP